MPVLNEKSERKPAEAFLNLKIKKKDGTYKSIKAVIPLDSSRGGWQERAIAKAKTDEDFEMDIVGTVHVVGAVEEVDDYDF